MKRDQWKPGESSPLSSKHFSSECFKITEEQSVRLGIRRRQRYVPAFKGPDYGIDIL